MYINPRQIKELQTRHSRNYHVSQSYISRYNTELENLSIIKDNFKYIVEATFETHYDENYIYIEIDFTGNILSYECSCMYQTGTIPCAHVFYVLHALQTIDEDLYIETRESIERRKEQLHNQLLLRNTKMFLDQAKEKDIYKWNTLLNPATYQIIANITKTPYDYTVDFKIGDTKKYVLKSVNSFIDALNQHQFVKYGKNLGFVHDESLFDEPSRSIISFMKQVYTQAFSISAYYYYHNDARYLQITPRVIDAFYDTFSQLDSSYHNGLFGSTELLRIPFTCEKYNQELYEFTTPILSSELILSDNYIYLFIDNTLYRYQKETSRALLPLIKQLEENGPLYLSLDMFPIFYHSIIEQNQDYMDMDVSIFTINTMEVVLKSYIELNEREQIVFDIFYIDGNDQEQILLDQNGQLRIKTSKTLTLLSLLNALDPQDTKLQKNRFVCNMNIDSFTKNVLPHLQQLTQVMVSDELMFRDKKTNYSFTTGVRLEGGILKLSISSVSVSQEEVLQVLREYRRKKKFYRLKNGETINLDSEELEEMSEMLTKLNVSDKDLEGEEISVPQYRAFTLDEIARYNKEIVMNRSENFASFLNHFTTPQEFYDIPLAFAGVLRDYQKEGYQWLKRMEHYGFGAILADDMGLGKTIQILALLESSKQQGRTSLVVCPASLILNWEDEVKRFSTLSCLCIHGSSNTRELLIQDCLDYDIVITSYDFMRRDSNLYENKEFYYIILDEAQYIKNQTTRNAHSVKELHGTHKLALSGTPIENSLAELWSIFDFLMPGYLYPYTYFKTHFETPIVRFSDEGVSQALKKMVSPFILRRIKKDVLKELPDKMESSLMMEFSEEEEKLYFANLALINQELAEKLGTQQYYDKMLILAMMTKLRQLCADPRLLYTNIDTPSTKIQGCMDLIQNAYENQKPLLLFSSFTSVLALLEKELLQCGISYLKLTGETSKAERHRLVEEFQTGTVPVFLISLKAGGTGLNLTAAEVVIHFDPWWNLSAQNQATDRAYRFGQTKNVQVYKLIMKNSIEEKILKLQSIKQELATTFVDQSEISIASMSKEELMDLFR